MQRWQVGVAVAVVAAAGASSLLPKHERVHLTRDDIRADVLRKVVPLFGRPEYAVTDADVVDPCLDWGIQAGSTREYAIQVAASCIPNDVDVGTHARNADRVAAKIAAYYAHPAIMSSGDRATVDAGVPPGTVSFFRGTYTFTSPYVEDGHWKMSEVERFLGLAMAQYPNARIYTASVLLPLRTHDRVHAPEWHYTYERGSDRIQVEATDAAPGVVFASDAFRRDAVK